MTYAQHVFLRWTIIMMLCWWVSCATVAAVEGDAVQPSRVGLGPPNAQCEPSGRSIPSCHGISPYFFPLLAWSLTP